MLILTRRVGESIMIGDTIVVKVVGQSGGQIKLGVQAPDDVEVHREEIYERIQKERYGESDDFDDDRDEG